MSQTQEVVQDHEEHRKEIVMCGYGSSEYHGAIYQWVTELTDIDCVSEEIAVDEKHELRIDWDGVGIRETVANINDRYTDYDPPRARRLLRELRKIDGVEIDHRREERMERLNSLGSVKHQFMRALFNELPEQISGGFRLQPHHSGEVYSAYYEIIKNDVETEEFGSKVINVRPEDFEKRRVLKKESERESGQMYESIGKVPSFQFQLILEAPSEMLMNAWTEEVIVNLHKILNKKQGIEKVRYTSCEVTTKKEGECFV